MSDSAAKKNETITTVGGSSTVVILAIVLIAAVFIYPLAQYILFNNPETERTDDKAQNNSQTQTEYYDNQSIGASSSEDHHQHDLETAENKTVRILVKRIAIVKQPSCPSAYLQVILMELCQDLFAKNQQCTPEDFGNLDKHKLPPRPAARNHTMGEPRATIVGCIAAGLLITSLGAALVELYKAKSQTSQSGKSKPPMSRKCSLADLTVLKHNRKELVRRESIMEMPEVGNSPMKQLGFRPPPLDRRCSFPVYHPNEFNNYNNSYTNPYGGIYVSDSRRSSIESRRFSPILDSRRSSMVIDCRKQSIDASGMRIIDAVVDGSPERRHHTRLVHRH